MGALGLRETTQRRGSQSPAHRGNVGPVLSGLPIFHEHLEIWKSPIFKCSVSSPNFSINVLAKWNRPVGPVYHPWNGSSQRSPLTHSLPFYVPGNCSQNSRVGLSLSTEWNIRPWAARSNALRLQAVPPPRKHSEMGPGLQNQSHKASQKLRAALAPPLAGSSDRPDPGG